MTEFGERDRDALKDIASGIDGIQETVRQVNEDNRFTVERLETIKVQVEELRSLQNTFATKEGLQSLSDSWDKAFEKTATSKELDDLKESYKGMSLKIEILTTDLTLMKGSLAMMRWGIPFLASVLAIIITVVGIVYK